MSNVNRSSQSKFETAVQVYSLFLYPGIYTENQLTNHQTLIMSYAGVTNTRICKTSLAKLSCHCPTQPWLNLLAFLYETVWGFLLEKAWSIKYCFLFSIIFFTRNVWFSRSVLREFNSWHSSQKKRQKSKQPNKKTFLPRVLSFHINS